MRWFVLAFVAAMLALAASDDVVRVASVANEQIIHKETPQYPPDALDRQIAGVVRMTAIVGTDGKVQSVKLISGHPLLAPAAMQAARRWVFKPFHASDGDAAKAIVQIEIPFNLPRQ